MFLELTHRQQRSGYGTQSATGDQWSFKVLQFLDAANELRETPSACWGPLLEILKGRDSSAMVNTRFSERLIS